MVTLVPPALVVQPTEYLEEWHDKRITSWDDDASPNPSIYFCPVLFHDSLGQTIKGSHHGMMMLHLILLSIFVLFYFIVA
jgi:hypothetical protein